ncbi:HEPN domain-containing protein [Mycolicibacterium wolinskyi]|uniref:HEPN domain-containing protein n=1 Tax=Mycolicibacterium wolinskyi TaxID=59750 RepID=UPI000A057D50|nr:HEPN domain-containing protein [Mycolicibacterium wolinskyi]
MTPEALLQSVAQGTIAQIAALPTSIGRSFNTIDLVRQIVSDRLELAGHHLRTADSLAQLAAYRSSISRYYYAMYHAARAICFGHHRGDNYQKHSVLPNNLPASLPNAARWANELNDARLVRNMADYDLYPRNASDWMNDSVSLSVVASEFLAECEDFAVNVGIV